MNSFIRRLSSATSTTEEGPRIELRPSSTIDVGAFTNESSRRGSMRSERSSVTDLGKDIVNTALDKLGMQRTKASLGRRSITPAVNGQVGNHEGSSHGITSILKGKGRDKKDSVKMRPGYTRDELLEYKQVFRMFDEDNSGAIGLDELAIAMKRLGMQADEKELAAIIKEVDQDGNGEIDFDEFCDVMKRLNGGKDGLNMIVHQCFDVFDRAETGVISPADFRYILHRFGNIHDDAIIEDIFAEFDLDSNGMIDYNEFTSLVKSYLTEEDVDNASWTRIALT